jgi:hypothetical protein
MLSHESYRNIAIQKNSAPGRTGKRRAGLLLLLVAAAVLTCLPGPAGICRGPEARAAEAATAGAPANDQDTGREIAPDEKDLDRLYRELLQGKKKETTPKSVMKATGKRDYYQVILVNGGTMRAKIVEIGKDTVTVTDDRGMVYKVPRQEILGIEEKNERDDDGSGR